MGYEIVFYWLLCLQRLRLRSSGNNECIEPFHDKTFIADVFSQESLSVINKYLVDDLVRAGYWTSDVRTQIIANNGSIQGIPEIPSELRELYRTAWEIPQKTLINLAADRAPFICQSQSLNLFVAEPTYSKLSSMHFYAWKKGLKTGCYYLRTKSVAKARRIYCRATRMRDLFRLARKNLWS
jgi:ribonucleoside-diphosphate reductase alpha chain